MAVLSITAQGKIAVAHIGLNTHSAIQLVVAPLV
jgi:hypothetical protein